MASLFSEDFETSGSAFWGTAAGSEETTIVHSGSKSWHFGAESSYHALGAGYSDIYVSLWVYFESVAANTQIIEIRSGTTFMGRVRLNVSGNIELVNNVGTVLSTGSAVFTTGTWYNIQTRFFVDDTVGVFEAKLGTNVDATFTGDTKGPLSTFSRLYFGDGANGRYYDDLDGNDSEYPVSGVQATDSVSVSESVGVSIPPFPTTSILDNFNRPDEGPPPSANWSTPSGQSGITTSGSQAVGSSTYNAAIWNVATYGADCEVYITLVSRGSGGYFELVARCSNLDASSDFYMLDATWFIDHWVAQLYRSSSYTTIGTSHSLSIGDGDSVGLSVIGDTLTVWEKVGAGDWTSVYSENDNSVTAAGYLGFFSNKTSLYLDDFGGGTIAGKNVNVSDSISVTESYSVEIFGSAPDLLLSISDSVTVSESVDGQTRNLPRDLVPRVSGTINGNQIEGYVRSLRRVGHICAPGQHATLILSPDWEHGTRPGLMCFLYEHGFQVMKGFIIKSTRTRPGGDWVVEIDDTYSLVTATFLDTPETTTPGHDTAHWAGYILEKCGANFSCNGTPASVPPGVQIGLRPASEALKDILAYASWYAWPDKNGVIQIGKIDRSISGRTVTEFTKFEYEVSDDMTRNVIKVYGTGKIFAVATNDVGLVPDRIAVVGSSLIESNAEAQRVADYLLGEIGDLTKIIRGTIPGNPKIKVGNVITMTHEIDGVRYSLTDTVSSLESNFDPASGYEMEVTIGERCPRISGWSTKIPWTYAGLNGNGVYVSRDKGVTWAEFNAGLPTSSKVATRVAGDSFGKAMAIVNGKLYYETGNTWQSVTLPSPGGIAKAVGALGGMDMFAVLTGSYVFFSTPSTGSEPPDNPTESTGSIGGWTAVPITTTDLTSGSTLYAYGYDIYSKSGTAYVNAVTSSGSSSGSGGGGFGTQMIASLVSFRRTDGAITGYEHGTGYSFSYDGHDVGWPDYIAEQNPIYEMDYIVSGIPEEIRTHAGRLTVNIMAGSAYDPNAGDQYTIFNFIPRALLGQANDPEIPDLALHQITNNTVTSGASLSTSSSVYNLLGLSGFSLPNDGHGYFGMSFTPRGYNAGGPSVGEEYWHLYDMFSNITGISWEDYTSGSIYPVALASGSYNLYTVNAGGATLVSDIPSWANANDKLYVADDGEIVLYNTSGSGKLLISNDFGATWHSAYPSANPTKVPAVTKAQVASTELITTGSYNTFIEGVTGTTSTGSYQGSPETSGGWQAADQQLPTSFVATDAIWSSISTQGILVGGGGTARKIYRYDPAEAPFGTLLESDTGIPSADASNVLDLEFGE